MGRMSIRQRHNTTRPRRRTPQPSVCFRPHVERRVRAIEATLDPLLDHVASHERELLDHEQRLSKLERTHGRRRAKAVRRHTRKH